MATSIILPPVETSTQTSGVSTPSNFPVGASSPITPVSGTTDIRAEQTATKGKAAELIKTADAVMNSTPPPSGIDTSGTMETNKHYGLLGPTPEENVIEEKKEPIANTIQNALSSLGAAGLGYSTVGAGQDASGKWIGAVIDSATGAQIGTVDDLMNGRFKVPGATGGGAGVEELPSTGNSKLDSIAQQYNTLASSTDPATIAARDELKQQYADLQNALSGKFTPAQQAEIEAAAEATRAQFAPLVQQAEEEKRKGIPKAVVQAGEMGGFLNTQFAGRGAVTPSEAGFIGRGGQLEDIAGAYSRNVQLIYGQRNAAVAVAKSAAMEAIRTGSTKKFEIAQKMYDNAIAEHENALTTLNNRFTMLSNAQTSAISTKSAQYDLGAKLAHGLISVDPNTGAPAMPTDADIKKRATEEGMDFNTLKAAVQSDYNTQLKASAGIVKGQQTMYNFKEGKQYLIYKQQQEAAGKPVALFTDYLKDSAANGASLTPDAVMELAKLGVAQGSVPTGLGVGISGNANRVAVMNMMADIAKTGGVDLATQKATYNGLKSALSAVEKQGAQVEVSGRRAKNQADYVSTLVDKVNNTGIPAFNRWLNAGRSSIAGDVDVNNLQQAITTLQFEYGKVATGAVGIGGIAISSQEDVNKNINSALTSEQMKSILNQIKVEIDRADEAFKFVSAETKQNITDLNPTNRSNLPTETNTSAPPTDNSAWGW